MSVTLVGVRADVAFVVTEHRSRLTPERVAAYEGVSRTLEAAAAGRVESVHYGDVDGLDAGAVVLSGSSAPWSAHDPAALGRLGDAVVESGAPVLGICAGLQLLAGWAGGEVRPVADRGGRPERGYERVEVVVDDGLLEGLGTVATVFQDHEDEVVRLPAGARLLARSDACEVQAVSLPERRWWGTQFHPERFDRVHPDGERVLRNFFTLATG